MPKYTQHQYVRYGTVDLSPPEGQLDQFAVGTHKDISGSRWKEQAPWSAASECVTLMSGAHLPGSTIPDSGVAPYPEGSHSSSPSAQEPQVRHGLALEISSLMLSSESYSWKQKPLEWPWQGVISKAAGPFSGF